MKDGVGKEALQGGQQAAAGAGRREHRQWEARGRTREGCSKKSRAAKAVGNYVISLIFCMIQTNISASHPCTWPYALLLMCNGWKDINS